MIVIAVALSLSAGGISGYLIALARTDKTIASMSNEEIAALSERIQARRKGG